MVILIVIVSLSILILVHELGHFLLAKLFGVKVEEFGLGFPPRLWKKKIGETVYSLNLLLFGGFVKIFGEDGEKQSQPTNAPESTKIRIPSGHSDVFVDLDRGRSFAAQPIWQRSVIVLAGIFMNLILGWLVLSVVFMLGSPSHLMVADVASDSPASGAGLSRGDFILEISQAGKILSDPVKASDFIEFMKDAKGEQVLLKVQHQGAIKEVEVAGRQNPPAGQGPLGVSLVEAGFPAEPFFKSIGTAFTTTIKTTGLIVVAFVNLFGKIFVSPEVLETVSGPVGIFALASQAGSMGLVYLLQLMALISLNLAVLNFIPFPALDGGRFLFLILEKIKGSPISPKFQRVVNTVGFAFLIVLMVIVTVRDISRL